MLITHPRPGVDLGPVPQEDADDVCLVCPGRQVQRSLPSDRGLVRISLDNEQINNESFILSEVRS